MAYLLAVGDAFFNRYEQGIVFYLGMVVWQMMRQSKRRLRKVTEKELDQAEKANFAFLERLATSSEAAFTSATQEMVATLNRKCYATWSKRLTKRMTLTTHPSVRSTGGWLLYI